MRDKEKEPIMRLSELRIAGSMKKIFKLYAH